MHTNGAADRAEQEVKATAIDSLTFSSNEVDLLVDGPAALDAMFAAIRQARSHIHIEFYIYRSVGKGETGRRFAQALREKHEQGVEVCLIYDPAGSRLAPHSFFRNLADQGIRVLEYNPVNPFRIRNGWRPNRRDHRKILIVDGRIAIMGGIDISDHYARQSYDLVAKGRMNPKNGGWHDVDVRIEGPAVAALQRIFLQTWQRQKGLPLTGNYFHSVEEHGDLQVSIVTAAPGEMPNRVHQAYLHAIGQARASVYIANSYFMPDDKTTAALCEAARRGVDVTLLLPGVSDFRVLVCGQHYYYDVLLRAGVRIFELHDRLLHAKVGVIDSRWCSVGSYNLDVRSLLHAEEVNAVIIGERFAAQLEAMFRKDIMQSKQVLPADLHGRRSPQRALQWLVHRFRYWL